MNEWVVFILIFLAGYNMGTIVNLWMRKRVVKKLKCISDD